MRFTQLQNDTSATMILVLVDTPSEAYLEDTDQLAVNKVECHLKRLQNENRKSIRRFSHAFLFATIT